MFVEKFCHLENGEHVPHDYGNLYFVEPCGTGDRLVIGPSKDHVELLIELAAELKGNPWFVLYVLLVPRLGKRQPGRYQSEPFQDHFSLATFMRGFRAFFEGDGRHHVWIASAQNDGVLVYDQHNVIFAYGPLERFKALLSSRGFRECEFWFPCPHAHGYAPENDAEEERLMADVEWKHFPMAPDDDWN
jgi:hypothetical protein